VNDAPGTPAPGDRRDRILLTGIRLVARHGVLAYEREHAQVFLVDLELDLDLRAAGQSDDLADTVDYSALVVQVAALVEQSRRALIEALAGDIAALVLADPRVRTARVRVHKPQALLVREAAVAVEVVRGRAGVP